MRILVLLVIFLHSSYLFSQNNYNSGYFTDNDNNKTECFLKEMNWAKNPSSFKYKIQENSPPLVENIGNIKSYVILDKRKHIKYDVLIDKSGFLGNPTSSVKEPEPIKESLFLEFLVEGDVSLLVYKEKQFIKYFYSIKGETPKQLIYNKYYFSGYNSKIHKKYKKQIIDNFTCHSSTLESVQKMKYVESHLVDFFVNHNKCINSEFIDYTKLRHQREFHISLKPATKYGISVYSLYESNTFGAKQRSSFAFKIGTEFECILPIKYNKWSLFVEPSFQMTKYSTIEANPKSFHTSYIYKSIELPLGFRYYSYLDGKNTIFGNIGYVLEYSFNTRISLYNDGVLLSKNKVIPVGYIFLGAGYLYKERIGVELRYNFNNFSKTPSFLDTSNAPRTILTQNSIVLSFIYKLKNK